MEARRLECIFSENKQSYFKETHRRRWRTIRAELETDPLMKKRLGIKRRTFLSMVDVLCGTAGFFLRLSRLYDPGRRNAEKKVINNIELHYPDLPAAFESYKILHLTDLHLDYVVKTGRLVSQAIENIECDLCVFTGDYRRDIRGGYEQIEHPLKEIVTAVHAKDGIFATLGNHDTYRMEGLIEALGVTLLANETVNVCRGSDTITVTGVDDPHYYYTDQAFEAMAAPAGGFKMLLTHSPELYDVAAQHGYRLYLCGHTHGGQISLPGGFPVITHLERGKKYYRGLWQYSGMKGYTNQGCGVVGLPLRFNTQSEIAVVTLHRGESW